MRTPTLRADAGDVCARRRICEQVATFLRSRPEIMRRSVQGKHMAWMKSWYTGACKEQLWLAYGDNREGRDAFYASYKLDDDDRKDLWEAGAAAFVRLERRLLRQASSERYWRAGYAAANALIEKLLTPTSHPSSDADFILVSIDFEGAVESSGVSEMGVTVLDTRRLFGEHPELTLLETHNFIVAAHSYAKKIRRYLFGDSATASSATELPLILSELCDIYDDQSKGQHKVILVGHGISSDVAILESLGVGLDVFPMVVGMLDTGLMAQEVFGTVGKLQFWLNWLKVPWHDGSLHCGGNDAHYTMRALLALLEKRCSSLLPEAVPTPCSVTSLGEIARAALPSMRKARGQEYSVEDDGLGFDELSELC